MRVLVVMMGLMLMMLVRLMLVLVVLIRLLAGRRPRLSCTALLGMGSRPVVEMMVAHGSMLMLRVRSDRRLLLSRLRHRLPSSMLLRGAAIGLSGGHLCCEQGKACADLPTNNWCALSQRLTCLLPRLLISNIVPHPCLIIL